MAMPVLRPILIVHRYLGLAVGALMTLWCLSGFVMMYQGYPALDAEERVGGLDRLDLARCCDLSRIPLADDAPVGGFRVEMLGSDPVLRLAPDRSRGRGRPGGSAEAYNLRTGERIGLLSDAEVLEVARRHGRNTGIEGAPHALGTIDSDQWTIQLARRNQPAHHLRFDDAAGTEVYVSASSGEVFQQTNRRERVLAWLGAIPHWLYPSVLRENAPLWTQVVIWTSTVGVFLTATGLYVGISRFKKRKDGRWSPFRGWWYWHHMLGLGFGVLTLTWVFSGLMTMNPWGLLEGGRGPAREQFSGETAWRQVKTSLLAGAGPVSQMGAKQLRAAPLGGRLYLNAVLDDGSVSRLDMMGVPSPLGRAEIAHVLAKTDLPVRDFIELTREDAYYYGHHREAELPVYRVILDDPESTRMYLSAQDGSVVRTLGRDDRISRWVRGGLHSLDFAFLRSRPVWYLVVSVLLLGVTAVCVTGAWMSFQRAARDWRSLKDAVRYRARPARAAGEKGAVTSRRNVR